MLICHHYLPGGNFKSEKVVLAMHTVRVGDILQLPAPANCGVVVSAIIPKNDTIKSVGWVALHAAKIPTKEIAKRAKDEKRNVVVIEDQFAARKPSDTKK